jgi:hypothetical protein
MPSSRQQSRQLTEHRVTLTINDQISVVIYSDVCRTSSKVPRNSRPAYHPDNPVMHCALRNLP